MLSDEACKKYDMRNRSYEESVHDESVSCLHALMSFPEHHIRRNRSVLKRATREASASEVYQHLL